MLKGIRSPTYLGIEYLTRNARIRRHDGHYVRLHRHGDAVCFQQRVTALLCDTEGHTSRDRDVLTVKHQGLGSPLSSILAARSQATFQLSLPLFLSTHKKYTSSHLVSHVLFFLDSVLFFISTANKTSAAALWKCSYYRGNQQRAVCVSSWVNLMICVLAVTLLDTVKTSPVVCRKKEKRKKEPLPKCCQSLASR